MVGFNYIGSAGVKDLSKANWPNLQLLLLCIYMLSI